LNGQYNQPIEIRTPCTCTPPPPRLPKGVKTLLPSYWDSMATLLKQRPLQDGLKSKYFGKFEAILGTILNQESGDFRCVSFIYKVINLVLKSLKIFSD
jgi:hypothetical protein